MFRRLSTLSLTTLLVFAASIAHAQNTADSTLELTFTLSGITKTDTLTNTSSAAVLETSTVVGDLAFEDFGPNGLTASGGAPSNPAGSIGTATSSELILANGLDPFVDDIEMDDFGIGDSWVSTMNTNASATTPDSIFFAQVNSENVLYFRAFQMIQINSLFILTLSPRKLEI